MRWRWRRYATRTGQITPSATGEGSKPCACAVCRGVTPGITNIPRPRSPVPIMPSVPPQTPTGDSYNDLVLVLGIAGAFGLILAVEFLAFVYFAFENIR